MRRFFLCFSVSLCAFFAQAGYCFSPQKPLPLSAFFSRIFSFPDTLFQLQEVQITDSRLSRYAVSSASDTISMANSGGFPLSEMLESRTSVFVKSYGLGSLSTTSLRGSGASHTAVLWHGINLQSPMNGGVDLSLLPTFFTDSVLLCYGGNAALWGSGAVGGVIHLKQKMPKKGISGSLWSDVGSFGQTQQGGTFSLGKHRYAATLRVWHKQARNDFLYANRAEFGRPIVRQKNAAFSAQGITLEQHFYTPKAGKFRLSAWWQQADRQIPPSMTTAASVAKQADKSLRFSAAWQRPLKQFLLIITTAYLDDVLCYTDSTIGLESKSRSHQWVSSVKLERRWRRVSFSSALGHSFAQAHTPSYRQHFPQRNKLAWSGAVRWQNRSAKLSLMASWRQLWLPEKQGGVFVPSVGAVWQAGKRWVVKTTLNRSFRLPTFNDLYWHPGGNPALKSEDGWAQEINLQFTTLEQEKIWSLLFFNKNIARQIVWQPSEKGYWMPRNLSESWVRGGEISAQQHLKIGKLSARISALYQFLRLTHKTDKIESALYVPEHQARCNVGLRYAFFALHYAHRFIGKRYTTSDFSSTLPHYQVGNLNFSAELKHHKHRAKLYLGIRNLWNVAYEVIAWQAMPGRSFNAGFALHFE